MKRRKNINKTIDFQQADIRKLLPYYSFSRAFGLSSSQQPAAASSYPAASQRARVSGPRCAEQSQLACMRIMCTFTNFGQCCLTVFFFFHSCLLVCCFVLYSATERISGHYRWPAHTRARAETPDAISGIEKHV